MTGNAYTPRQWLMLVCFAVLGTCVGLSANDHNGTVPALLAFVLIVILVAEWPQAWLSKEHKEKENQ